MESYTTTGLKRIVTYKILEDSDFSLETTPILDLRSGNSLDGTLLSCLSMCANRDFSISSFTDVLKSKITSETYVQ